MSPVLVKGLMSDSKPAPCFVSIVRAMVYYTSKMMVLVHNTKLLCALFTHQS
jgi:hypothetical protein